MNFLSKIFLLMTAAFSMFRPVGPAGAQAANPGAPEQALSWRMIGPFRGGRTVAITGVPGRQNVFYMAPNHGGIWKSTDFGRVWKPIFDDQPTGSIGALAIAPTDSNVIYVGSGEGLQRPDLSVGDGVYRSRDGGKTWMHLGLRDGQQITAIRVDPRNADRLFAAVLGHPYGANTERGIFRSEDGGETWKRVLYRDENTGAAEMVFDPVNPDILYADLWSGRQAPWEVGSSWDGPGSGLYKSTDGGGHWLPLTRGLPAKVGRIGFAIAPSAPGRLYAIVDAPADAGVYRSDDAGESWTLINRQDRLWGRGSDFAEIRVHPRDPDTVFIANTSTYRSKDAGKTWTAIKGAPGGDDYHRIWINPENPEIIALGSDQGATISVNAGESWSSWYNQPTAQFYHVTTDNRFPYWVYGAQQESGSAGVASRGDYGAITAKDWMTVGVEEYGYIACDPLNPDILYGGKLTRFDRRTGDVQTVLPEALRSGKYRYVRTLPVIFSTVDRRALYFAANVVFRTRDGGQHWDTISPDLTRETYDTPANLGVFASLDPEKGKHRGVVYTLAPSHISSNTLWAGTDDGLIHITRDGGKSWTNVTPPTLTAWSKVSLLDAGHFDDETAYAAINRFRLDDLRPHILRTHDGGKTWQEIVAGIPANEVVNSVREDPVRRGLLFCGTERAVYYSLDDGGHWRPLRQNMPSTAIRDLVIHDADLVVGTHGRSFWIMDDISPLRQAEALHAEPVLLRPHEAVRVRRSRNTDTPLPPEEPMGQNPPDGAILDYWLPEAPSGPVVLEIRNGRGDLLRRYASDDTPSQVDADSLNVPTYWIRRERVLSARPGMHRWIWDLHAGPLDVPDRGYPISAIFQDTPAEPIGLFVPPGSYTVRLLVNGKVSTQTLTVKADPRVKTPRTSLAQQYALAARLFEGVQQCGATIRDIAKAQKLLALRTGDRAAEDLSKRADTLLHGASPAPRAGRRAAPTGEANLEQTRGALAGLLDLVQSTDQPPTSQTREAATAQLSAARQLLHSWSALRSEIEAAARQK